MEEELLDVNRQNMRLRQLLGEAQRTFELIDEQRRKAASIIESHEQVMTQKALENSQLQERLAEMERTTRSIASIEHQLEFNKSELARLATENESLKQEIKTLVKRSTDLTQYKYQAAALASELAAVKKDLEATNVDVSRTKEELSATIATNRELRIALSSSTDQLTVLLALLLERRDQAKSGEDGAIASCSAGSFNDQKHLYDILSCRSAILDHFALFNSSAARSPLSIFLLSCTLFTQQLLLRQLCAFINQGILNLSDSSERLSFLLSAFALSLVEDFISVFLDQEEKFYLATIKTPSLEVFKAALSLSSSLQDVCGDSLTALEEVLLTGILPTNLQLKLSASRIRGLFGQVLPILFSSMDILAGTDTGLYAYSTFLSASSLVEKFIFVVTAYIHRAILFDFQRPFMAFSSSFFLDTMTLLCPAQSAFVDHASQSGFSVSQVDCLLATFSDQLSVNQSSSLLDLIGKTRGLLSEALSSDSMMVQQKQTKNQSHIDIKALLTNAQTDASQQFHNLVCAQDELRVELDRTRTELASLREEHAKTVGLLRIANDRIAIAEETTTKLQTALSAQLIT
ncbi:Hypothetical protein GLP15_4858 [Giardia lamblia P15]|uniref:Uncharacterized protein n=1 Tax=Giardia intestinalis (strain P15) TaxID=658858 RepID=E1EYB3_GIAIA|nr:Hypothetical protein GLP15_4858 [Giardia lamblia P15]